MKKSILSALFVIPQLILAQTLTSSNGLRAGDELCRTIVWLPESQPDGDYAVWNMQDMLVFADGNVTTYAGLDRLF